MRPTAGDSRVWAAWWGRTRRGTRLPFSFLVGRNPLCFLLPRLRPRVGAGGGSAASGFRLRGGRAGRWAGWEDPRGRVCARADHTAPGPCLAVFRRMCPLPPTGSGRSPPLTPAGRRLTPGAPTVSSLTWSPIFVARRRAGASQRSSGGVGFWGGVETRRMWCRRLCPVID